MNVLIKTDRQAGVHVPEDKWTLWEGEMEQLPNVNELLILSGQPSTYVKSRTWSIDKDGSVHVILWVPIVMPLPRGRVFYNKPAQEEL